MYWPQDPQDKESYLSLEELSEEDGTDLVRISLETIKGFVLNGDRPSDSICGNKFRKKSGVFVTIKKSGELRGCIGYPYPVYSLCNALLNASIASATEDPRFSSIGKQELQELSIEVTVLSLPEEIDQFNDSDLATVKIGMHGLIAQRGYFNGLLLPQVAVEENLTVLEFLSATCVKAGLSQSAWKDKETKIFRFEGRVYSESEK